MAGEVRVFESEAQGGRSGHDRESQNNQLEVDTLRNTVVSFYETHRSGVGFQQEYTDSSGIMSNQGLTEDQVLEFESNLDFSVWPWSYEGVHIVEMLRRTFLSVMVSPRQDRISETMLVLENLSGDMISNWYLDMMFKEAGFQDETTGEMTFHGVIACGRTNNVAGFMSTVDQ
ncbi:hypothetical protein NE237_004464 [Protea cynaroides]|uniref:Uncharacterized protein n=1 Tax=Protea cynaroides TaxID=273540 RepID=A0A9Q0QTD1_9MAGN|nr:hypothetical protein NE237_004464 [Protea cynaroides]